jgi:hypothetical protein
MAAALAECLQVMPAQYDRCAHTFLSAICIAATFLFWINQ